MCFSRLLRVFMAQGYLTYNTITIQTPPGCHSKISNRELHVHAFWTRSRNPSPWACSVPEGHEAVLRHDPCVHHVLVAVESANASHKPAWEVKPKAARCSPCVSEPLVRHHVSITVEQWPGQAAAFASCRRRTCHLYVFSYYCLLSFRLLAIIGRWSRSLIVWSLHVL